MMLEQAIDIVVKQTGHVRYRYLTSDENPDEWQREEYRKIVLAMAATESAEGGFPSVLEMAGNAAKALGRIVKAVATGQPVFATAEEQARRLAICAGCEKYDAHQGRCSACGCFGKFKAALETERGECPLGRWSKVAADDTAASAAG